MSKTSILRMSDLAGQLGQLGDINTPPLQSALDYIRELIEANDRLVKGLEKFGLHRPRCWALSSPGTRCRCGYVALKESRGMP